MAKTDSSAVAALPKLNDESAKMQRRIAEARRAAATELGEVVLSAGAESIPPRDLKLLLVAVMKLGPAKALELIAGGETLKSRGRSNGVVGTSQEAGDGHL